MLVKNILLKSLQWIKKRSFNEMYLTLTFINIAFTFYTYKTNLKPEPRPFIFCDADNALFITQSWGNVAFNQNILISNYGTALGTVYSIDAYVEYISPSDKDTLHINITAQNTYDNGQSYRVLPINLAAAGWVQNQYSLYQTTPDEEIDFINRLTDTIESEKRSSSSKYKITATTKTSILRYINKKIHAFKAGNYAYLLCFRDDQGRLIRYQCYTFTLSETNIWLLKQYTKSITDPGSAPKQAIFTHLKSPSSAVLKKMIKKYLHI